MENWRMNKGKIFERDSNLALRTSPWFSSHLAYLNQFAMTSRFFRIASSNSFLFRICQKKDWWMSWFNQCQIEKTIIGVDDKVKLVPNKANSPRALTMDQFFVNSFLTEAYWPLKKYWLLKRSILSQGKKSVKKILAWAISNTLVASLTARQPSFWCSDYLY